MTREELKAAFHNILADRLFLSMIVAVVVFGVIYCVMVALAIRPHETQIYARYTAYGEAHFYKDYWQYLMTFVGFGIVTTSMNILLMMKLYILEHRHFSFLLGFATIITLTIAMVYTQNILGIG